MSDQQPARIPGVGDLAPEFSLPATPDGDPIALTSYRGQSHVLLAFYVFDFSPG
jgi:peroxiredoxin